MNPAESRVAICGAGTMGAQIAFHCALKGYTVTLYDINTDQLDRADSLLHELMEKKLAKGKITQDEVNQAFARLKYETSLEETCSNASLIIEAIIEDLPAKKKLFSEISSYAPKEAILATNSSSIVSSKLASKVHDPSRLCNIHFFNPALVLPLVEVVKGDHTSEDTVDRAIEFVESIDKTPVRLEKEIFGFITNRILAAIFDEAISLYENGIADFKQIDTAVKAGLNHPLGPFELLDLTGIDVNYGIKVLEAEDSGDPSKGPSQTLTRLYQEGRLGRKSGQGFYVYEKEK